MALWAQMKFVFISMLLLYSYVNTDKKCDQNINSVDFRMIYTGECFPNSGSISAFLKGTAAF
jgi:hypothetical protein